MSTDVPATFEWADIRLVAFDVDGTLYRQRPIRLRMAVSLVLNTVRHRDLTAIRALSAYRRIREQLGDAEEVEFMPTLLARTAALLGSEPEKIAEIVEDWMERKPLPHLALARYRGVDTLFDGMRANGRLVGILSDYPVHAKLVALGLVADHVVSAVDAGVARLKPHPSGLNALIAAAGVEPAQTVLIGDRAERDGMSARRAGAHALIRSSRKLHGWTTFARFDDPIFAPFLKT